MNITKSVRDKLFVLLIVIGALPLILVLIVGASKMISELEEIAVTNGTLKDTEVRFSSKSACCVILASKGYPVKYQSGFELTLPECDGNTEIFVAGAKKDGQKLLSAGGRVLGITAVADTLGDAVKNAYALTGKVGFENGFCRSDIGKRALAIGGGK